MNAQVFKPDWDAFQSEKYTIDFQTNITTFYGLDTLGELHFQLKSDPSKFIVFFVFERSKITEEFDPESSLSCIRLADDEYIAYWYKQFHYLLSPWQNCETANDVSFKALHGELFNFIIK